MMKQPGWFTALSLTAGLSCALAIGDGTPAIAAPVYSAGHSDIGVAYEGGNLELHYHFGSDAVAEGGEPIASSEFASADAFTRVLPMIAARPAGGQWDFLGTPAGSPLWFLSQSNSPGQPFLGFGTEELDPADWSSITWSLTNVVSAPAGGAFSLWQTDFFGNPVVKWDSADGLADDHFVTTAGGHDHYNWGFTKTGVYTLEFTVSATHDTDGAKSDSARFTFLVGPDALPPEDPEEPSSVPEPASLSLFSLGGLALLLKRRGRKEQRAPE